MTSIVRGNLRILVVEAQNLANLDTNLNPFKKDVSDPYCEIKIGSVTVLESTVENNSLNPKWNAKSVVPLCYFDDVLDVKIWDKDIVGSHLVGKTKISLNPVGESWHKKEWFPLDDKKGTVFIELYFDPFVSSPDVHSVEPLGTDFLYFAPTIGGALTLYQDARDVSLNSDDQRNAFDDISDAIEKARRFIYISGWSVWTQLQMKRGGEEQMLGDILKRKADEGVRVLVLVWSEKFSSKLCRELFGTHHLATIKFFANTKVTAMAVRRQPENQFKLTESIIETIYTHHMKTIVVDCPDAGLVGFIGGFDLTDGRWDTPEHFLWKTLKTYHKGDFYNGFSHVTEETGPREPWHDVHARFEGLAVFDLLNLFEERWKKQASEHTKLLIPFNKDELTKYDDEKNPKKWHMQILRSSDSDSSLFDPTANGLISCRFKLKDCSVHHGLVSLIRSCKKFLYIESQYFIGSAPFWSSLKDTCALNSIPIEICEQISHSIRIKQPIRVYVLLPMCPEGDPTARIGACYMSEILHWQYLTIQMMFARIAKTLKEVGSTDHPEDFLLFLCLGKKLKKEQASRSFPSETVIKGSPADVWREKSRFLIYVHSKMALSDDARIVIGSANFNERSLHGSRDTEACLAASQVDHEGGGSSGTLVTDGEISRLRRSLWSEHTGGLSDKEAAFKDPSDKNCISFIKKMASKSLQEYANDEIDKEITFRFLKYPLEVGLDGQVTAIPSMTTIPDFGLSVTGADGFIPSNVTT